MPSLKESTTMHNWNVSTGKKSGGPFDTAALRRLADSGKLPRDAFVRLSDDSTDWQQASTVDWLVDDPQLGEARYCLECDCRAIVSTESAGDPIRCPQCFAVGHFVTYLEPMPPEILDVPHEPWGIYDGLACAFAVLCVVVTLIGIAGLLFNPSVAFLLGFILLACGAALFAMTFHHRSESSKYRSHLKNVESTLAARSEQLVDSRNELVSLKRGLNKVRDDLIAATDEECRRVRREIQDELAIAKDQQNAVHRMAEKLLTETRKWWTSKLTGQNYQITKDRMMKAIEFCRKQGYTVTPEQQREVFNQLKIDYEAVLAKEHAKAEQMRMREQLREEQRVQRELQRELEHAEKEKAQRDAEEDTIRRALAVAMQKVGVEHSAEVDRLKAALQEAHQRAIEAEEAAQRTKSQAELTRVGNVYVISNIGSFGENAFKVGLTRRLDPYDRVKELGDASVPFPFDVHMMIKSDDAPALERKLHRVLHRYRINRVNFRKEFFRIDLSTIQQVVEQHHGKVEYLYEGAGEESEYEQSLKISDADFAYLASVADEQGLEEDDDDAEGIDEP